MLLSIYTFIKNGLFFDYHVVDMLKHHLPFADEIIVNEGYSTDGTYERISNIDPKIRIFRTHWPQPGSDKAWYLSFKNEARREARGEWCLLLDADEFVPEWEFETIRAYLQSSSESMIAFKLINFYGSYKVYFADPAKTGAPFYKMLLHRNTPEFEVWGDGADVRRFTVSGRPCRVRRPVHQGRSREPGRVRSRSNAPLQSPDRPGANERSRLIGSQRASAGPPWSRTNYETIDLEPCDGTAIPAEPAFESPRTVAIPRQTVVVTRARQHRRPALRFSRYEEGASDPARRHGARLGHRGTAAFRQLRDVPAHRRVGPYMEAQVPR